MRNTQNTFLFAFAYESPAERKTNRTQETDYESTAFVRITASNEKEAREWGEEIAQMFSSWLHHDATYDWRGGAFASWIETNPDEYILQRLSLIPLVAAGEMLSDFARILTPWRKGASQ